MGTSITVKGLTGVAAVFTLVVLRADLAHAEPDQATVDTGGLDEIVVTAQRRSENLERTPVAVAVIGADALAAQDIVTQSDLRAAVPGLTVRASLNSNDLNYSIRGQTVAAHNRLYCPTSTRCKWAPPAAHWRSMICNPFKC